METSSKLAVQASAMKTSYEALRLLATLSFFITACVTQALPAQKYAYEMVLGKSMTDKSVIDFMVKNNCSPVDQFQMCKEVGMALWIDTDQIVKTIYLYAGYTDGFKRYQGELPFGLSFYDPMWLVHEKLRDSNADDILNQAGLPEESGSPDHAHYWAIYNRFGITIIYNSPFANEDAYIYAIAVSSEDLL
jgi:hypothetical protein